MTRSGLKKAIICAAIFLTTFAVHAEEREIFFNDVEVSEHNIQVIERSYDVQFDSGRYWYDRSPGLWGSEGSSPEGRIATGLHIGGPTPEALAANGSGPAPEIAKEIGDEEIVDEDEMSAEDIGELVGGILGLMMLGEMMDQAEEAYYDDGAYQDYGDGSYQTGPNSYYDGQGNYDYVTGGGSGSQYSDGSWIHSSNVAGGSVGGTSDGCVYTNVGGGWSNC